MKDFLLNYSRYNVWAVKKITDFLKTLSEDQLNKEIISSFPSIRKTMMHIWDAQVIWLLRLQGQTPTAFPGNSFSGSFNDAVEGFIKSAHELSDFVESSGENFLLSPLTYKNLAGEEYKNRICDILMHVINHGTHHRGQIITM